ncbi:MAG: hypothetical protein ACKO96_09485, partial [Flammeovirgaceae bacterium]
MKFFLCRYFLLRSCLALPLVCFWSWPTEAQDFKAELMHVKKIFSDAKKIQAVMSIKGFDSKAGGNLFDEKAIVLKDSSKYYSQFNGMEMLLNETYLIIVSHQLKRIQFLLRTGQEINTKDQQDFAPNLDSLLRTYGEVSYKGKSNEMNHYEIMHGKGAIKSTNMFFDALSGMLKRIEYHYTNGQKVQIEFDEFDTNPKWGRDKFS